MTYFEADKEYFMVWPALAVSLGEEFWIGLAWLNFEFGWRNGDYGDGDYCLGVDSIKQLKPNSKTKIQQINK